MAGAEVLVAVVAAVVVAVPPEDGDMRTLAERFFSTEEAERIKAAVARAEAGTAGEIVVMVVSASHNYPAAHLRAALLLSLPLALVLAYALAHLLWWPSDLLWPFLAIFCTSFLILRLSLPLAPWLWRLFIRPEQAASEVEREAVLSFYSEKLHHTRQATGVLLFLSVLERRVWILADSGISAVLPSSTWQDLVQELTSGIRRREQGEATCRVVERIGGLLAQSFPPEAENNNELVDLIIRKPQDSSHSEHALVIR
ncbi:MAG: hypothetical protein HQQ73_03340 [Desulfobulbaceae bacterium]|nr:hypothetical protein [Desulfobulbaceae bacterium]